MRRTVLLAALLLSSAPAQAQQPSPNYTLTVESPGNVALGDVPLRVRVSGGVREPEGAAYHMRTVGGWSEAESLRLPRVGEDLFEDVLATTSIPNDAYRIEIRVWSEVPPYDPDDQRTYSRTVVDVAVDNPPATPERVQALSPANSLRLGWEGVQTTDRSDFIGYRVLLRKGHACPADLAAYRAVAEVDTTIYVDEKLAPGEYCLRVAAVRESAITEVVLSSPSSPVRVEIQRGNDRMVRGGSIVIESNEAEPPPPPPALGEGDAIIADGSFIEDLPYGPRTVTQHARGGSTEETVAREAGVDPRRTPTLIAGALILLTLAGQVRRFLAAAPKG